MGDVACTLENNVYSAGLGGECCIEVNCESPRTLPGIKQNSVCKGARERGKGKGPCGEKAQLASASRGQMLCSLALCVAQIKRKGQELQPGLSGQGKMSRDLLEGGKFTRGDEERGRVP